MAVYFKPLPLDPFTPEQQPHIAMLNQRLRDVFGLEGALRNPRTSRRSDRSVVRHDQPQVDVSRVTPAITQVVSGQSTVVGTPQLTLGTANTIGTTTTALSVNSAIALFGTQAPVGNSLTAAVGTSAYAARADHRHQLSDTLLSVANASTLILSDDGTNQTLFGSLGGLILSPRTGSTMSLSTTDITMTLAPSGQLTVIPDASSGAVQTISVQIKPSGGNMTGILSNIVGSGSVSSGTLRAWAASFPSSGQMIGATFVGFDMSTTVTISPSAGSDSTNCAYMFRGVGPLIGNATGGWTEIATACFQAPRRVAANPSVLLAAGIITEPATIGSTSQIGLYVRQRAAQAVAANRYGILIDAQNSGTTRYSIYGASDIAYFGGNITHAGSRIALYNASGATQSTGWSASNITAQKTLNGSSFTLNDVMNTLGTLLTYLQVRGDIGP